MSETKVIQASVGSMKWKNDSTQNINEARKLTKKISNSCDGRVNENIKPGTRQNTITYTNEKVNQKFRTLRQISNSAREYLIDINQQIRSGNRTIELLDKRVANIERDEAKNQMSVKIRKNRPAAEKEVDNADLLLKNEANTLKEQKQLLNRKKQIIKNINSKLAGSKELLTKLTKNLTPFLSLTPDNTLPPKYGADDSIEDNEGDPYMQKDFEKIIDEATNYIAESKILKSDADQCMKSCDEQLDETKKQVNQALRTKVVETKSLQKELKSAIDEVQQLSNKNVKAFKRTEHSWLDMKGPESRNNASVNEKPDRPLLKAFQQPLDNHPEIFGQKIGSDKLMYSMKETVVNMEQLRVVQETLQRDVQGKKQGAIIDSQIKIIRNQKIKHPKFGIDEFYAIK
ncbi:hypothetical protein HELRODRAFT_171179 [Helobdella robusta]|uniref:Tektin n=1 Tax=Helobdella robusta TaxID=6412 RepID=T1F3W6_HELRO|nr:hypothetical protein HELRODRAFT_171179 [Helobdella robusta]ESO05539.1 hypothetical protein HELRODRAFT_171179 [Helobdella robusta]